MDRKFFLGLVLVGIFIGNQIVEEMGIYCDFINSYLDDSKEQRSQTVTFKQYVLKAGSVCYQSLNYVKNIQ